MSKIPGLVRLAMQEKQQYGCIQRAFAERRKLLVRDLQRFGARYGFHKKTIRAVVRHLGYKKKRLRVRSDVVRAHRYGRTEACVYIATRGTDFPLSKFDTGLAAQASGRSLLSTYRRA
jgi:hypothetical protein